MTQDGDIDYSRYTRAELDEALAGIDPQKFPKNLANLRAAFRQMTGRFPPEVPERPAQRVPDDAGEPAEEEWPGPQYDADGRYLPNRIPPAQQFCLVVLSLLLLAYGGLGVAIDDLFLPGRRRGIHLHGNATWLMYAAMICASLVLLSVVLDHYDRRDNERYYRAFAKAMGVFAWIFAGISLFTSIFRG